MVDKPTWGKSDKTTNEGEVDTNWWSDTYGFKTVKDKKTGKNKKVYVGQTQYLNQQLGNTQLQGVLNVLGYSDNPQVQQQIDQMRAAASFRGGKGITANQTMFLFKNAPADLRAQIQSLMYRAGNLYDKTYVPSPGAPLTKQDIDAFRKFIIGVASNPAQGPIDQLLVDAASSGDSIGAASKAVYKPLIQEVTNPDDIKNTANQVGLALHGTYLTNAQMSVFTAAYQTMEKAYKEQEYVAEGGDPSTGWVDPDKATGAVVTKPASVQSMVESQIRNQPDFQSNTFTDRLDEILGSLRGPMGTSSTQVGPL